MKLVTAATMREIDRRSIEERGVPPARLMEAAGQAVALDVAEHFPRGSAVVICGKGNNGADGFVVARRLAQAGWHVAVVVGESPAAGSLAEDMREALPPDVILTPAGEISDLASWLGRFDVAVDALLGIGLRGPARDRDAWIIEALNEAHLPVFAVDIPSGLDADLGTGGAVVRAFRTVTFGHAKVGMVRGIGPAHCGTVRVERINFPADLLEGAFTPFATLTTGEAAALLPLRPTDGHKGTFGMLLLAAGSEAMPGAAILAALGAVRGGCGLVRLLTPHAVRSLAVGTLPEILRATASQPTAHLGPLAEHDIEPTLERARAWAIGPGMGTHPDSAALLEQLLETPLPGVIDADALNLLVGNGRLLKKLAPYHVLTPHPGEAARLLETTADAVQRDRWARAVELAKRTGATVLLKGAGTLIATPDGHITHCGTGNTAWARGGAGDVLTGVVGSLLAQGASATSAARLGAFVHGMAADLYAKSLSPRGARTTDLVDRLPEAFRVLEEAAISSGVMLR